MLRPLVLGLVAAAGLSAIALKAQNLPPAAGGFQFGKLGAAEKLAEDLYLVRGAGGNTAVFVHANGVMLVDTKIPGNGQGLLDVVRSVTDKPVTQIVNTHHHFDHAGSNAEFPASVEIVAHQNAASSMAAAAAGKNDAGRAGLPDRTYQTRMTLLSGRDAVDLYYFGRAHTSGDTYVVFRRDKVMHAGDTFPLLGGGLVDRAAGGSALTWPATVTAAARGVRGVDRVITGHGPVVPWQDFVAYGEFQRSLVAYARTAVAAGKTAAQAQTEIQLPARLSKFDLARGKGQPGGYFNTIYAELQPVPPKP